MSSTQVVWFRRDLRLTDHPALLRAAEAGTSVVALFVIDPRLFTPSVRAAYLTQSLTALAADLKAAGGQLVLRLGDPRRVVAETAAEVGADAVHVSADFTGFGARRDADVDRALRSIGARLVATGSPYAVAPGRVRKADETSYRVFTPYYRAWLAHGWRDPAAIATEVRWASLPGLRVDALPDVRPSDCPPLPAAGERAALTRWEHFRASGLAAYAGNRDRPDLPGTSELSAALRFGEIHPRTLLADLAGPADPGDRADRAGPASASGAEAFRRELAFREFYADVLWQRPESARQSLDRRFDTDLDYRSGPEADADFECWCAGRTGYPFVDAGMRQLLATGWIHNRVRMVVASFLVKDLHLPWWRGADWFFARLRDGDLASNSAGWQWTAGCGTDASPYHRIFNPVAQGKRFDPNGDYIRHYIPELAALPGASAHEPWLQPLLAGDYPPPMVDHAVERQHALARFAAMKAKSGATG